MRHAAAIAAALCFAALPCSATLRSTLTILLEFDHPAPQSALTEMEKELGKLLHPAGLNIEVKLRSDVRPGESFEDLLVVTLKGTCDTELDPVLIDERGPSPLAFAHTVGSTILPFTVISCDTVRRTVEPALWGGQRRDRDMLFGRAMGRVLAHELYHVLAKTSTHSRDGIFRKSLTGAQLISETLNFTASDIETLRKSVEKRAQPAPLPSTQTSTPAATADVDVATGATYR